MAPDRYHSVGREIADRGVGSAIIESIGLAIESRTGKSGQPWFSYFAMATPAEEAAIGKAVAEWADGDALASHIASGADFFCTEDQGKSAGLSVLNADNRLWAETTHGVKFVTLAELSAKSP
ncbi:MAG: hypothetical protein DCF16_09445 [Alphaproteobacteria bacterium]|nr:MAG: hypothetical protein DCF16_09445 [Alphaproteobacteria bacterium]